MRQFWKAHILNYQDIILLSQIQWDLIVINNKGFCEENISFSLDIKYFVSNFQIAKRFVILFVLRKAFVLN